MFGKLPPFIPSSQYAKELAHFQSPEEVPGCIKLIPCDAVSKYLLSGPSDIIVQPPTIREYFWSLPCGSDYYSAIERPVKKLRLEQSPLIYNTGPYILQRRVKRTFCILPSKV